MIEKDTIQELFSKAFENHSAPVKPELWAGVQAKMSAAGVAGAGGAAAKGLSALTKWAIGSAALTSAAVVTTVAVMNSGEEQPVVATNNPITEQTTPTSVEQTAVTPSQEGTTANTNNTQDRTIRFIPPTIVDDLNDSFDFIEFNETIGLVEDNSGDVQSGHTETVGAVDPAKHVAEEQSGNTSNQHVGSTEVENPSVQKDPEVAAAKLELPNVFTPNGDGANDLYKLNKAENIKAINITVIDANGREVFKSDEINFEWNGTILNSGDQAAEGIYTCLVQYRDMANGVKTQTSYIYLKR